MSRIRLESVRHTPMLQAKHPSIAKLAVYCRDRRMFDAYLYEAGDWWCTAGRGNNVFPRRRGIGFTDNAYATDLRAFADAHAVRLGLLKGRAA